MIQSDTELSAKSTSRGKRVFISNAFLTKKARLAANDLLDVHYDPSTKIIRLIKSRRDLLSGESSVSVTTSGKRLVVDLHNKKVAEVLGDNVDRVSLFLDNGVIEIHPTYAAKRRDARMEALRTRISAGQPIQIGEVCHGVGGLGLSLHEGIKASGVPNRMAFANDYDLDAMEASFLNNKCWDKNTIGLHASMEQIDASKLPQVDLLVAGLSCKGASRQSRTGKKISMPEFHPEAGSLILPFFHIVASVNPLICIVENVREYLDTASAHMLQENMRKLSYVAHEVELSGQEFGSIENRKRAALIFVTEGMHLPLEKLSNFHRAPTKVLGNFVNNSMAPPVPTSIDVPVSERNGWYPKSRLLEREREAIAKGTGHRAVIADMNGTKVSTLTASLGKGCRLDESVVESDCGNWVRLFSPEEHALIKGLPQVLIAGVSKVIAHRLLGNSVVSAPWIALGQIIGQCIRGFISPCQMAA